MGTWSVWPFIAAGIMLSAAPVWADARADLSDPSGDTVDADEALPLDVPQADIVRSSIVSGAEGITLNVQVRNPTAPLTDKAWDGATDVEWSLDTTGDGHPDFSADYFTDAGRITGDVYRFSDNEDEPVLCQVKSAVFSADTGYTAVLDPACIGAPATVAYLAEFSYDTNPDDDNAPVAEDGSPDTGLSPKVDLHPPGPAPESAPPTEQPAATPPPPPVRAPAEAISTPVPAPPAKAPPAPSATSAAPPPAPQTSGGREPAAATGAVPRTGTDNLGRTGRGSQALMTLGGAVIALGGLCIMGSAGRVQRRSGRLRGVSVALADRRRSW